jgi:acetyl-CoA synthetase
VFKSGGYRIGPIDIEKCIFKHPSVQDVAVVGSPDPIRGHIAKAFIQLKEGEEPSGKLTAEIQEIVKINLAAHEYPREIEFTKELPRTSTGKIRRYVLRELEESRKQKK